MMETGAIISVLGTVILGLLGFIRYLFLKQTKDAKAREQRDLEREERAIRREEKLMEVLLHSNVLHEKVFAVLEENIKLLKNWRRHS